MPDPISSLMFQIIKGINILDSAAHFYRLILPSFILQWNEKKPEKNI
jgi:hypothetical protein